VSVVDRLYPTRDPLLSAGLYWQLRALCPTAKSPAILPNDLTSLCFDNRYFKDLLAGRGLFAADAHLVADARTAPLVAQFAENEALFFQTFASAFRKMVSARVLTGNAGQVRTHCRRVN
jgi:peroxidase